MPKHHPRCPSCSVDMEKGVIIDRGHGNHQEVAKWLEGGEMRKSKFLGIEWSSLQVSGHKVRPIESYRCPNCGLLQNYAD